MRPTRDRHRAIVLVLSWLCAGLLVAASLAIVFSGSPTGGTIDGGPDSVYQGPEGQGGLSGGSAPGAGTAPLTTTADQSPARGGDDALSVVGGTDGRAAQAADGTAAGSDGGTTGGTTGGTSGGNTGGTTGGGTSGGGTSGGGTSGGGTSGGGTSGGGTSGGDGGSTPAPPPDPEPQPAPDPEPEPCLCDSIPEVPIPVPSLPSVPSLPAPIPNTLETVESTVDDTTGTLGLGG